MSFIRTFSGNDFDLMAITPDEIKIEDIAASLSKLCRYGGHTPKFYSVAEHSVHVATRLQGTKKRMLAGLLHDASEAYVQDIIGPLKGQPFMSGYCEFEFLVQTCIEKKFNVDLQDPEIERVDKELFKIEFRKLMKDEPEDFVLPCWEHLEARYRFLSLYTILAEGA